MTLDQIRDEDGKLPQFAWPGGYVVTYGDSDGSDLCADCANKSDSDPDEVAAFKPVSYSIETPIETRPENWDQPEYCDSCGRHMDPARRS